MSQSPTTTENIRYMNLPKSLLGNDEEGTGLVELDDLSIVLAATGALGSAIASMMTALGATVARGTFDQLTLAPVTNGHIGIVLIDPVEAKRGVYEGQSGRWVRVDNLPADAARMARVVAEAARDTTLLARDAAAGYAAQTKAIRDALDTLELAINTDPVNAGRLFNRISNVCSICDYEGLDDDATENASAFTAAIADNETGRRIVMPRLSVGIYQLNAIPAGITNLVLDPDEGITIKSPFSPPRGLRITRPVKWHQTTDNFTQLLSPDAHAVPMQKKLWLATRDIDNSYDLAIDCGAQLSHASIAFPNGTAWAQEVPFSDSRSVAWGGFANDGKIHTSFYPARVGDQVTSYFAVGGDYTRGWVWRFYGGWAAFTIDSANSGLLTVKQGANPPVQTPIVWQAKDTTAYRGDTSIWTSEIVSPGVVRLALNGVLVSGDIVLPAVVIDHGPTVFAPVSTSVVPVIRNWTVRRRAPPLANQLSSLGAIGDSRIAQDVYYGGWMEYCVRALDGTPGLRFTYDTDNKAVSGDTAEQQLAKVQSEGWPNTYVTVFAPGTNDIQGQTNLSTFETTINALITGSPSPIKIGLIPLIFYDTPSGQVTGNAGYGMSYRSLLRQIYVERGLIVVDEAEVFGAADPAMLQADPDHLDAIYRDDIHWTSWAEIVLARYVAGKIANAILGDQDRRAPTRYLLPQECYGAGVTGGVSFRVDRTGRVTLSGSINCDNVSGGTVVLTLPPMLSPARNISHSVFSSTHSSDIRAQYSQGDHTIRLYNIAGPINGLGISLDAFVYDLD